MKQLPAQVDLPAVERAVLERWERDDVFARSLEQTADGEPAARASGTRPALYGRRGDVVPRHRARVPAPGPGRRCLCSVTRPVGSVMPGRVSAPPPATRGIARGPRTQVVDPRSP